MDKKCLLKKKDRQRYHKTLFLNGINQCHQGPISCKSGLIICHFDRIHSSLTDVGCFDNGYVGKQQVAWKEYCAEYWLKELQKSMDRCTGHQNITEILLKTALNTIQSINQPLASVSVRFG